MLIVDTYLKFKDDLNNDHSFKCKVDNNNLENVKNIELCEKFMLIPNSLINWFNLNVKSCDIIQYTRCNGDVWNKILFSNIRTEHVAYNKFNAFEYCITFDLNKEYIPEIHNPQGEKNNLMKMPLTYHSINNKTDNMGEKLKIGDVVCLKSGSPKMTIQSIDDKTNITVVNWFDYNYQIETSGELNTIYFNPQEKSYDIEQLIKA